jgi:hypothetical protein
MFQVHLSLPHSLANDVSGHLLSLAQYPHLVDIHMHENFFSNQAPGNAVVITVNFNTGIIMDDPSQFTNRAK